MSVREAKQDHSVKVVGDQHQHCWRCGWDGAPGVSYFKCPECDNENLVVGGIELYGKEKRAEIAKDPEHAGKLWVCGNCRAEYIHGVDLQMDQEGQMICVQCWSNDVQPWKVPEILETDKRPSEISSMIGRCSVWECTKCHARYKEELNLVLSKADLKPICTFCWSTKVVLADGTDLIPAKGIADSRETGTLEVLDKLADSLGDAVNRLMEHTTQVQGLVKAVDQGNAVIEHQAGALWGLLEKMKPPKGTAEPFEFPRFDRIADREPTQTERMCFLAGVGYVMGHEVFQENVDSGDADSILNELGVPMVNCACCERLVPSERAFRVGRSWYGVDCCEEEGVHQRQFLQEAKKNKKS